MLWPLHQPRDTPSHAETAAAPPQCEARTRTVRKAAKDRNIRRSALRLPRLRARFTFIVFRFRYSLNDQRKEPAKFDDDVGEVDGVRFIDDCLFRAWAAGIPKKTRRFDRAI